VCQGKREKISFRGRALDFAVSAEGSYIAVQENLEPSGIGQTRQLLVPLKSGLREIDRRVDYPESLYATCGTVVSFEFVSLRGFDLIHSQAIEFPPYKYFRCSSDRQVTAGWTEQDDTERTSRAQANPGLGLSARITLRVSRNGRQKELTIEGPQVFDVSQNGNYLTYVTVPGKGAGPDLCVAGVTGEPSCIVHYADAVSVSDTGEVIFWAGEIGVMYWRPDLKKVVLLEKTAMSTTNRRAQWITPDVAKALHSWASSLIRMHPATKR